jgi:hypothetical protein
MVAIAFIIASGPAGLRVMAPATVDPALAGWSSINR